jgi:hypothetical protein
MARKCAKCGVVSEIEDAFLKSDISDEAFYCPACSEEKSIPIQLGESFLIACPVLLIGGLVWVITKPQNEFAWLVFQAGLFMCFIAITTLPHELGHVLASFAVGGKVYKVTIGLGKILYKRKFLGIEWEFGAIPICGVTYVTIGDRKLYRTRSFLISSGGPLVDLFMLVAAVTLLFYISSPWLLAITRAFLIANMFELAHNLLPRKINFADKSMSSDGLTLLNIPFMSKSKIDKEIEGYYAWEGYEYSIKGRIEDAKRSFKNGLACFPDSVELQICMGRVLLELGNYADARNMFIQLQKRIDHEPETAVRLLNEIATADIMMGTEQLLDEADAFSKTACEKMPWRPEFKGTRGLLLSKKGQIEEGLALLKEAKDKTEDVSYKEVYAHYITEYENKRNNVV